MAKQNLNFNVNFTATGNFSQLNSSLKKLKNAHTQAFGAMMSPALATKSPFDAYAKGLQKGTLKFDQLKTLAMNTNKVLAEHNALSRASGVVMKDAAGNARTYLNVNRAFGATLVTNGQRLAFFNTLLSAGAKRLVTWGKNIQWAGRQVMVGLTLPLAGFGAVAMKAFETFEKQITRVIKVTNVGLITMEQFGKQVSVFDVMDQTDFGIGRMELANESIRRQTIVLAEFGAEMGFLAGQTSELVAEFSQMGYMGTQLDQISRSALTLSRVSGATLSESIQLTRIVAQSFGVELQNLTQAFAELNLVENNTALSLQEMSEAIPIVASVADNMGLSVGATAGLLAIMKENGIAAREGATALRTGLIKLVQQATPNAIKAFEKINLNLEEMQEKYAGNVLGFMVELGTQLKSINANSAEGAAKVEQFTAALGKLVGVRASARFLSLVQELDGLSVTLNEAGQIEIDASNLDKQSRVYRAFMATIAEEQARASRVFQRELDLIQNSQAGIASRLRAQLNMELTKIGESFLIFANKVRQIAVDILRAFNDLPEATKQTVYVMGAILAAIGPVVMIAGVLANAFGQVMNVFSKLFPKINLVTAAARAEQLAHTAVNESIAVQIAAKQQLIAVNQGLAASTAQVSAAQLAASISQGLHADYLAPDPTAFGLTPRSKKTYKNITAVTAAAATSAINEKNLQNILPGISVSNVASRGPGGTSILQVLESNIRREIDEQIAREMAAGTLGMGASGKRLPGKALTNAVSLRAAELASDPDLARRAAQATSANYATRGAQAQVASLLGLPTGDAVVPGMSGSDRRIAERKALEAQYRLLRSTGAEGLTTMEQFVSDQQGSRSRRIRSRISAVREARRTGVTSMAPSYIESSAAATTQRIKSAKSNAGKKIKSGFGRAFSILPDPKKWAGKLKKALKAVPFLGDALKTAKKLALGFGPALVKAIGTALGAAFSVLGALAIPIALVFGPAIMANPKEFLAGMMGVLAKPLEKLKGAWNSLVDVVKVFIYRLRGAGEEGGGAFAKLAKFAGVVIGLIAKPLVNALTFVVNIVTGLIQTFEGVTLIIGAIVKLFTGDFTGAFEMLRQGISSLWDGFKTLALSAILFVVEKLAAIPGIGRIFRGLEGYLQELRDSATEVSDITRAAMESNEMFRNMGKTIEDLNVELEAGEKIIDDLVAYEIITDEEVDRIIEIAKEAYATSEQFSTARDRAMALAGAVNTELLDMQGITDEQREQISLFAQRTAIQEQMMQAQEDIRYLEMQLRAAELDGTKKLTDARILEYAREFAERHEIMLRQQLVEARTIRGEARRASELARITGLLETHARYTARVETGSISAADAVAAFFNEYEENRARVEGLIEANRENLGYLTQGRDAIAGANDEADDLEDAFDDINSVVSEFKSGMGEVLGDIEQTVSAIEKMQEETISDLFDSISENLDDFFDNYIDRLEDQIDAIEESIDAQYDAEITRIEETYQAQIDAIDGQMKEEERLEKIREDNFNKEKARIEFLKGLKVSEIGIQEAILRGDLGEAAILSVQRSADVESFFMTNVEERYKELSDLRKEQMRSEIDLLKEQMDAEKDAAENRKDDAKDRIDDSKESAREAMDSARERANAEIEEARRAAEEAREREEQRIENYLREWRRVTPATEEEFAQHTANLQAFLDQSGERLRGEINAINNNLRGSLGSISSEFEGTNNEIVDMINTAASEAGYSIESIADSLVMNSTNSLMASLSSVQGFVSGVQTGFVSAAALTEEFLRTFERNLANGFARARDIAIIALQEASKWEEAGQIIMAAIQAGLNNESLNLPDNFAEQMANYDWGALGQMTGNWGGFGSWEGFGEGFGPSATPERGPGSDRVLAAESARWAAYAEHYERSRRHTRGRGPSYLEYRPTSMNYRNNSAVDWMEKMYPMAKGGIVTKPIFPALVGEAGPEAIIPLSKIGKVVDAINRSSYSYGTSASLSASRSSAQGSASTYNLSFNINGANLDEDKLAKRVMFEIQKTERSVGMGRRV